MHLYTVAYRFTYPFSWVYSRAFWRSLRAGSARQRMFHLVAAEDDRLLAHLALRGDGREYEAVSIAVAPEVRRHFLSLARQAWRFLSATAERQGWETITFACASDQKVQQFLARKCFEAKVAAFVPGYFPVRGTCLDNGERRTGVLLLKAAFKAAANRSRCVHLPRRHAACIATVYRELGLVFHPGTSAHVPARAERHGVQLLRRSRLAVVEMLIDPESQGAVDSLQSLLGELCASGTRLYLRVALDNPLCPSACDLVEAFGCRFCGVYPGSRDYLLFSFSKNKFA